MTHHKGVLGGGLKDLSNSLPRLRTALDVPLRTNLLSASQSLCPGHRPLIHPSQVLDSLWVVPKIHLASYENDGQALAEVKHFRNPLQGLAGLLLLKLANLFLHVIERIRRIDREADEDDMRVRIRQRAKSAAGSERRPVYDLLVIFLAGGIP